MRCSGAPPTRGRAPVRHSVSDATRRRRYRVYVWECEQPIAMGVELGAVRRDQLHERRVVAGAGALQQCGLVHHRPF